MPISGYFGYGRTYRTHVFADA